MITCRELGRLGRLGNMMFQVAGCIGIARKSGQNFAFPKLICHDMIERFGSKEDPEVYKYLVNPLPEITIQEIDAAGFQRYPYFWDYKDIHLPNGNWDMYAHFQSIKFFQNAIDEVRHYFTFKDEYPQNDFVAIHYRAGDYIDNPEAYHPRCSKEYYEKAIEMFPGEKFILFSDNDQAWFYTMADSKCKGVHLQSAQAYFGTQNFYLNDFKLMKSCKSFICANSSFSHMAALLGTHPEKKIVMPKRWFGAQASGLNFDSLYPENAIVI